MSYHVMPHILDDPAFSQRLTNCVLVRDPIASIPSGYRTDPGVTCEEIGPEAQWQHLEGLCTLSGKPPSVIRAEDMRNDPEGVKGAPE